MSSTPWKKFKVGKPSSRPRWEEKTCRSLATVAHVAHVPTALRIVEDRRLRADLVFDESKLNTHRIRVVWLSPNDWDGAGGFRYGNVRFQFDWPTLVAEKKYYWVESIAYGIEACRLLVTEKDYSSILDTYDPTIGDGPWWRDGAGQDYWNGEYCLEVMYEGDLDLDRASKVDFVRHHERMCNIDAKKCVYRGASDDSGGSEFIVSLASRHLKLNLPGLVETKDKGMRASSALYGAVGKLTRSCAGLNIATWGSISSTDPSAISLGRAVLNSIGNRAMQSDTANLACLFKSTDDLQLAISAAIDNVVGLPSDSGFFHELSQ